jgi:hypothetical protein
MDCVYYSVDTKSVIFERFEDEVIAIHLDRGIYYSLNETAADVFELLSQQPSREQILAALAAHYAEEPATVRAAVEPFLDLLLEEKLIATVPAGGMNGNWHPSEDRASRPFVAPSYSAHRDMQELFLLDPIHDVGEAGWPEPGPAGS